MNKIKISSVSLVIVILMFSFISSSMGKVDNHTETKATIFSSDGDYDRNYYLEFNEVIERNVTFSYSKKYLNLTTDSTENIVLTILTRGDMSSKYDFKFDLVIVKEDWKPRYIPQTVTFGDEEKLLKEEVEFYSNWYTTLDKKTQNVVKIENNANTFSTDDENKTFDISINILQGGIWQLYMLVKPKLGDFYLPMNTRLDLIVDKPNDLSGHMYYVFPLSVSSFIFIITVCTRKRYHILPRISDKK